MGCKGSKPGGTPAPDRMVVSPHKNTLQSNLARTRRVKSIEEFYTKASVLGKGAYGEVCKATDKISNRTVAMKCINKSSIKELDGLRNEIALLRGIEHPNIVRLLEVLETDAEMFFTMELCTGGTVLDLVNGPDGFLPEAEIVGTIERLCSALSFLHVAGVCHRDVKLENIMFNHGGPDREIMLCDLGTGHRFDPGEHMHRAFGSIFYLAPDMIALDYTEKCDMWSVGICAYMMCCRAYPFMAPPPAPPGDVAGCMTAIQWDDPVFEGEAWERLSPAALLFVKALLNKDPAERPSADEALASDWLREEQQRRRAREEEEQRAAAAAAGEGGSTPATPGKASAPSAADGLTPPPMSQEDVDAAATRRNGGGGRPSIARRSSIWGGIMSWKGQTAMRKTAQLVLAFMLEPELVQERRRVFQSMDTERNGVITKAELCDALDAQEADAGRARMVEAQRTELFESLDMDKTGRINYLEFLAATVPHQVLQDTVRLRQAFDRLDADSSGFISKRNLKELMGSDYDEHSVAEMIASADIKNNGRIDFEEFLELMQDSKATEARPANVVVEMPSVEDEG